MFFFIIIYSIIFFQVRGSGIQVIKMSLKSNSGQSTRYSNRLGPVNNIHATLGSSDNAKRIALIHGFGFQRIIFLAMNRQHEKTRNLFENIPKK